MRFLVDECTGPAVAGWLRDNGHEVYSVFDEARGMADDDIIRKALSENETNPSGAYFKARNVGTRSFGQ